MDKSTILKGFNNHFFEFVEDIITMLFIGISKKKDSSYFVSMFFVALGYFIFYFQNRLLYSMCIHSA